MSTQVEATLPIVEIDMIGKLIAEDIKTRFGFHVETEVTAKSKTRGGEYGDLAIEQDLGIFAMIVSVATIRLRAEPMGDGAIWVLVSLNYDHTTGGSNGHNIGTYWIRDDKIENFRAG